MSQSSYVVEDDFVKPSCKNLSNIGPGCFVRIEHNADSVWIEITGTDDDGQLQGIMHPELSGEKSTTANSVATGTVVKLKAEQVNALGCNRYCYCD